MVFEAATAHQIDLGGSYFVGDKSIDVECGKRAGTRTVLVLTGGGSEPHCAADLTCRDAVEAAEAILAGRV
jgi:D-glycero-D-manno-heptose 1,7-bisphosphate phosphatase